MLEYHWLLRKIGKDSVYVEYPEYADIRDPINLSGSIPSNDQMCAVSEVHPLAMKFVNVMPCFWIRSK